YTRNAVLACTSPLSSGSTTRLPNRWRVRDGGSSAHAIPVSSRATRISRYRLSSSSTARSPNGVTSRCDSRRGTFLRRGLKKRTSSVEEASPPGDCPSAPHPGSPRWEISTPHPHPPPPAHNTGACGALPCMASFSSSLHGGSTLEAGGHRVEVDVRPAFGVHKLLPAEVKVPLIVLGDVAFGHQPRVVWMQPCVAHSHGQFLSVLAGDGAATRGGHLAPVVDVILLQQSRSPPVC